MECRRTVKETPAVADKTKTFECRKQKISENKIIKSLTNNKKQYFTLKDKHSNITKVQKGILNICEEFYESIT